MKILETDYFVARCSCGAEAQVCLSIYDRQRYYFVACPACGLMSQDSPYSVREAVDRWNEQVIMEGGQCRV